MNQKRHLGDNVYAQFNRFGDLVLTTENAVRITNSIVLETEVLQNLEIFLAANRQNQNQENL